ncbi:MAG TPA: S9 family peptidase, partial [Steroidobacteraceae bacterium]|nr:S9 family peptidase [Steroidobacteraceae bacterium]
MRIARGWMGVFLALCAGGSASAGESSPLTPAQALSYVWVGDLHFSPDGSKLAFVVGSYKWDALPHIRISDIASGATREITPSGRSERTPQWSADGKTLAFLSNRGGGRAQVFLLPMSGGEAKALTASRFGVRRFRWSPDGRGIAYLAQEDSARDESDGPQLADDESNLARVWFVDVSSRKTRRISSSSAYRIDDFQWQGPSSLLVSATDRPRVEEYTDRVYRLALADGLFQSVGSPPQPFNTLLVSPDATQYAVRSTNSQGPRARDLFVATLPEGELRDISAPLGLTIAEVRWHEQDVVWVRAIDGFYNRIFRIRRGESPQRIDLPLSAAAFDVSNQGVLAYVGQDYQHLPEIYLRGADGSLRQMTHLQQGWEGISLASSTIFRTVTADNLSIEAALLQSPSSVDGHKRPLVLLVHGGPPSNFSAGYDWEEAWAQLLVSRGYQVLMVNPRGSDGYSEAFLKANRADWGGGDYRDLMSVLDAVVARGSTDAARIGIGGWSYGGEMAAWAITQTDRFKAAVAGACVFDQAGEFETEEDDPAADEWYFGTPWEHPDVFARNSPVTFIGQAHTPTLILDGEDDANNPVGQSKGLYRALKHLG